MTQLIKKQLLKCLLYMMISGILSIAVIIILALFKNFFSLSVWWCYFVGTAVSLIAIFPIKKRFYEKGYFSYSQLKENNFWTNKINSKSYIKKQAVILSLIPYLILGVSLFTVILIFFKTFDDWLKNSNYFGFSIICALLSSVATTLIIYFFIGLKSFKFCKFCGAVNSFIYDDDNIEHISITAFGDYRTPGFRGAGDMSSMRAITKQHGDSIMCHCANCNHDLIITITNNSTWSGL